MLCSPQRFREGSERHSCYGLADTFALLSLTIFLSRSEPPHPTTWLKEKMTVLVDDLGIFCDSDNSDQQLSCIGS